MELSSRKRRVHVFRRSAFDGGPDGHANIARRMGMTGQVTLRCPLQHGGYRARGQRKLIKRMGQGGQVNLRCFPRFALQADKAECISRMGREDQVNLRCILQHGGLDAAAKGTYIDLMDKSDQKNLRTIIQFGGLTPAAKQAFINQHGHGAHGGGMV